MASFPSAVVELTPVVDLTKIEAAHVNTLQDEVEALEQYQVGGYSRGGPLDRYMTANPGLSTFFGSGSTRIAYDAGNDRLTINPQPGDPVSGAYFVLPTPLQLTPFPTARVEFAVEFMVDYFDPTFGAGNVFAGFFNHANPASAFLGVRMYQHEGGGAVAESGPYMRGTGGALWVNLAAPVVDTRYRIEGGWQKGRGRWLSGRMDNATTGVQVTGETGEAAADTNGDVLLPDFGVWFDDSTGVNLVLHVYDLYFRVIRS